MDYYNESTKNILKKLDSNEKGISTKEATKRIEKYGQNVLKEEKKESNIKKFLTQFTEPLMILLIIAGVIAIIINDIIDGSVILFVVLLNAIIGYNQENKAENAMEQLKSMTTKKAIVLRDNKKQEINAENLVVGDILILEEGDQISADIRIIENLNLKVNESSLTGESLPVSKTDTIINNEDETNTTYDNLGYMNTEITMGRGKGVVIATGMNTKIGKIAEMIQNKESETPLQIKISKLGQTLGLLGILICAVIFVIQFLNGIPLVETFMTAVSLAVAAIPEGLPTILTLTLAFGMQRMAKSNAIVRKLLAVETLGSCTVICTDKTGTLTLNQLTVTDSYLTNEELSYKVAGFCNNGKIDNDKEIGDPTDISLLKYAKKNKYDLKENQKVKYERLYEIPLDSSRKRMTTITSIDNQEYVLVKGAPEILIDKCTQINKDGKITQLNNIEKNQIKDKLNQFTNNALRVLLLAYKTTSDYTKLSDEEIEDNLIFVGLVGMMDPPRDAAKKAIKTCSDAKINVKMITGDHPETASAIAKKVNIKNSELTLTGYEIDQLSDEELSEKIKEVNVYARVFPEQKVRIVNALKENDEIVSMTGDGVNDAPALKNANIGVAMGSGTDVAKQSSDMILQDDNFATIVTAVKEGRTIFENIKRFIRFQLSTNIAAILTILTTTIISAPIPFNPVQLLWINIIMDGPPAQSLGVEPSPQNIMKKSPQKEDILSKPTIIHIVLISLVMAVGTLGLYLYELSVGTPIKLASTIAFTLFIMFQLFNVFNCKATHGFENKTLIISVIASFILQLCAIYIPVLQTIFGTVSIPLNYWVIMICIAATIIIAEEIIKVIEKRIID
ncbi:MAG: calcium-translocating P-type ATPase, PMCA-type [Methanobacteriaceae archaeon]|nr:calcium-translocating P-type ATPase, PMCA-type [Methanobacteriaceae archaeon]